MNCADAFDDGDDEDIETFKVDVVDWFFSVGLVIFCDVLAGTLTTNRWPSWLGTCSLTKGRTW